jgi:serine O-acetyltransferase
MLMCNIQGAVLLLLLLLFVCVQNVTLGGTGKDHGDRHPKISDNVLIGASATVLGNIRVGEGAQIAAGSLVLKPVTPHTMVAGSPAKVVGHVTGV